MVNGFKIPPRNESRDSFSARDTWSWTCNYVVRATGMINEFHQTCRPVGVNPEGTLFCQPVGYRLACFNAKKVNFTWYHWYILRLITRKSRDVLVLVSKFPKTFCVASVVSAVSPVSHDETEQLIPFFCLEIDLRMEIFLSCIIFIFDCLKTVDKDHYFISGESHWRIAYWRWPGPRIKSWVLLGYSHCKDVMVSD